MFGYAILNDFEMAEWGNISYSELLNYKSQKHGIPIEIERDLDWYIKKASKVENIVVAGGTFQRIVLKYLSSTGKKSIATEDDILLIPASYNQKGIHGDFQVSIKGTELLRPYTSVKEYFKHFTKAEFVYLALNKNGQDVFYKINREDQDKLDGLEPLVENPDFV